MTQIAAATKKGREGWVDSWANLLAATRWEEIQMLAQDNEYIREASQTMYQLSAEEAIRWQCEAREEGERVMRGIKTLLKQAEKKV